jgi:enamine deaminase RidA (YjgF/YER057c/UK114 family)
MTRLGEEPAVERRNVNPWSWQDQYGFSQAIEVSGNQRTLICAGQTSTAPDGSTLHAGDIRGQVTAALDNLETVLGEAGFALSDVVRLNYYTTDIEAFFTAADILGERLGAAGIQPASTLLGVTRLAFSDLLVEIEATAVK